MAAKIKKINELRLIRPIFINKKTGQPSITLPKKKFIKIPKSIDVLLRW